MSSPDVLFPVLAESSLFFVREELPLVIIIENEWEIAESSERTEEMSEANSRSVYITSVSGEA